MPALPLDAAGPYVAGAFLVFVTLIVIYVAILGTKIARVEKELQAVAQLMEDRSRGDAGEPQDVRPAREGT